MSGGKFSVFTSSYVNTALNQSAIRIHKCYIIIEDVGLSFELLKIFVQHGTTLLGQQYCTMLAWFEQALRLFLIEILQISQYFATKRGNFKMLCGNRFCASCQDQDHRPELNFLTGIYTIQAQTCLVYITPSCHNPP